MIAHVDRRHRHDAQHHELGHHHDGRRQRHGSALRGGGREGDCGARCGAGVAAGDQQGVGAQPGAHHDRPAGVGERCEHEGPGEGRDVEALGECAGHVDQVRSDHRSQRGRHQHGADRAAAPLRVCQIGAGVAGLEVRRGARAVEEERDEQKGHAVDGRRGDGARTADRADPVAERETWSPTGALRERPDQPGGKGRAKGEERGR